jgi:hypothetical protein
VAEEASSSVPGNRRRLFRRGAIRGLLAHNFLPAALGGIAPGGIGLRTPCLCCEMVGASQVKELGECSALFLDRFQSIDVGRVGGGEALR